MKHDLDRAMRLYRPPPDAFERMMRRRDAKRTKGRVMAATAGFAIAAAAAASGLVALRGNTAEERPAAQPPAAVLNGRVAFTERMPAGWNLFTVDPDGSDERRVTSGVRDYWSSWSPDGTKLAVDTEQGLTVMNADGSDAVAITSAGEGSTPDWSPDGTRILFTDVDHDGRYVRISEGSSVLASHIFAVNPDGSGKQQLTSGPYSDYGGSWSPDGSQIVFARSALGEEGLYVMDADGSHLTRISNHLDTDPDWSSNGSQIVYSRSTRDDATIFVMKADGSDVRKLTSGSGTFDTSPAWSPDGSRIAFTRELLGPEDDGGHIYVMSANGMHVSRLTDGSREEQAPSWGTAG